ncbi:hypothetical protein DM860_005432 [Cuscuta australis]|uniref:non-specific serine/threonine protein kinase n=1 Tax=Cuscuta australis TaxID=267555 RepID=A0A328E0Z1_9ASTE|nr:hypothetical protein DM860_005432 [Cuscuta australis]
MSSQAPGAAPAPTSPPAPSANATSPPPAPTAPPPSPPAQPPPPSSSPPPPSTPAPSTSPPAPLTPSAPAPSGSSPPSIPSAPPSRTPSPPSRTPPSPPRPPPRSTPSPPPPRRGGAGGSPATPSPPPDGGSSGLSTGLVAGIAIGGVLILAALCLIFICCRKKRRRDNVPVDYYAQQPPPPPPPGPKADSYGGPANHWQHYAPPPLDHVVTIPPKPFHPPPGASRPPFSPPPPAPPHISSSGASSNYSGSSNPLPPPSPGMALGFSKSTFTYEELERATDGFSDANLIGQGGFGYVHRGILPNGKEVAVKRLKSGSGQGEREFQAEVEIISRVHHKHLVSLVGYCIAGSQRVLVYEFVPNNTLEYHLHGKGRPPLDWPTRLKIALGSAKGLAYLHEDCNPKIIHRDIKAANILLDFKFEPKVADFGLAKLTSDVNTHVSTRVMGTFGYLAPEYASSGKLSEKSDVFSFGVMLLELITGRRPVDSNQAFMDDSLVDWARPLLTRALEEGNFNTLVDPRLENDYNHNEISRMIACAAACVRHSARRRPRMSQVVRALEGQMSLSDLNEGIRPGQSTGYSSYGGSSDYDTMQYNEDMKKMRKMALGSQEYSTGQYSNPTSEYGLNPSGSSSEGQEMTMKKESSGYNGR